MHLIREIKSMAEEKLAIALLLSKGRVPQSDDFTPVIKARIEANATRAEHVFNALHSLPRPRFLAMMELVIVVLSSAAIVRGE